MSFAFPEDVQRIVVVCRAHGITVTPANAERSWRAYSNTLGAGWMKLPAEDGLLFQMVKPFAMKGDAPMVISEKERLERCENDIARLEQNVRELTQIVSGMANDVRSSTVKYAAIETKLARVEGDVSDLNAVAFPQG